MSRGVSTRTTVQILAGILLGPQAGKLELAATDMELSLRTSLDAQVEGEGRSSSPAGCWSSSRACCPAAR